MRHISSLSVALTALVLAASAVGQTATRPTLPAFELERLQLNPNAGSSLVLAGGELAPEGTFRLSTAAHYANSSLLWAERGSRAATNVSHRAYANFTGAFSPRSWMQLGVSVPVLGYQRADQLSTQNIAPLSRTGIGTPFLSARFLALSEKSGAPLDVAAELGAGLPIGTASALAREDGPVLVPRVSIGKSLQTLRVGADLYSSIKRPTSLASVSGSSDDLVGSEIGGGVFMSTTNDGALSGQLNLVGAAQLVGGGYSFEALAGARYQVDPDFGFFMLGGPGFGTAPGTPTFRLLFGAMLGGGGGPNAAPKKAKCVAGAAHDPFDCPELDKDEDGIANADDSCPSQAEDRDGVIDQDGCPDPDNDDDGLVDARDQCPNEAGSGANAGCPVKDQDGDTLADRDDQCPLEAGPAATNGCPDQDGDGIATSADRCPAHKGSVELKGCPDQDGDKVADLEDKCPAQAGIAAEGGCPAKDADEDGIADAVDNCPKRKGTVDNAGCPAKNKQLVQITKERLVIKDSVYFATNKATLLARSNRLLNQIAQVLKQHPEITSVSVEGHTDNVGKPDANLKLSQARAEAVKRYLVKKGIAASRLQAKGFGGDQPIESNTTREGREANRRVEFKLGYQPDPVEEEAGPVPLN